MRQWSSASLPGDGDCVDRGVLYSRSLPSRPNLPPLWQHDKTLIHSIHSTSFRIFLILFLKWLNTLRFYPRKCRRKRIKTLQRSRYNNNLLFFAGLQLRYWKKKKTRWNGFCVNSSLLLLGVLQCNTFLFFLFFSLAGPQCECLASSTVFTGGMKQTGFICPFQPRHRKIIIHKVQQ